MSGMFFGFFFFSPVCQKRQETGNCQRWGNSNPEMFPPTVAVALSHLAVEVLKRRD